jgi:hypothetical protein
LFTPAFLAIASTNSPLFILPFVIVVQEFIVKIPVLALFSAKSELKTIWMQHLIVGLLKTS